uniref:Animal hem peroxidase n=1 Tax=Heterorhabditis bacteriophora TaxID=37862 RepID=A0A1I7XPE8_HETBA
MQHSDACGSRLLPSAYDDEINALVASITRRRPNPREVSIFLLSSHHTIGSHANSMLMQFGQKSHLCQFVSHDITKNALSPMCTCQTGGPMCANVLMPPNDGRARSCIPFTRSFQVCGTGIPGRPREQYNENTAYIDGSLVYSSEAITLRSLRIGAMLRTNIVNGRVFPPNNGRDSMTAGDSRATIFLGLAAMHTTFLRLHNNLAAALMNMNRHWNQDRVFQETRKIVGSIIQVITYQEFLPALIGPFHARLVPPYRKSDAVKTPSRGTNHLYCTSLSTICCLQASLILSNLYDANVNPAVINEFAGAAYRLHGMIQETYPLIGSNFESRGQVPFLNGVGRIEQVLATIDAVYRGFIATPARNPQRITTSVTEQLFSGDGDMATFNIQRGRDHGFRSYNEYRKLCQLKPVKSFEEWPEVSDSAVQNRIAQLYQTPDDLDLYVGGIIEEPIDGSAVGPTFACIIAEQFVRLRDGDSMTRIVPSAFTIDRGQQAVPCSSIVGLDLSAWKD